MNHAERKAKGRTTNNEPTLTDQSMAKDTDINVIVGKFGVVGKVPGQTEPPMYGDFTTLPNDLRGFLDRAKSLESLRQKLPVQLRDKTPEELAALTPDELKNILTPPAQPPAKTEETK